MVKKTLYISLALFGLLFSEMAEECFADVSAQLEQADAYMKDKNYEQAEAIYQQIVKDYPGTDDAFQAQRNLPCVYIAMDQQSEAEAALQKLLTDFSEHQYLPHAVHEIAEQCCKLEKGDTVRQLYQNVLDNQPQSEQAIWAQMGVAISNNYLGDETATKAAIEKLIAEFSKDNRSAGAVGQIAWSYRELKKYERAKQLYQYVVDNWAYKGRAIFSQRGIALCNIALGDETAARDAVEKLLTNFSEHKQIAKAVNKVADDYRRSRQYEKARRLYQYVVDHHPESKQAIWAQRDVAISSIKLIDDDDAAAAVEKLLANFSEHKQIAEAVNKIADHYRRSRQYEEAHRLYQYVVDNQPESEQAIWAQRDVAISNIQLGDDPNAQMALDNLIVDFNSHSDLPAALYKIARKYEQQGKYEQARSTYLRIIQQAPASPEVGKAQLNVAKMDILSLIESGDDPNAQAALDRLIADFNDHPGLPRAIFHVGEEYYNEAFRYENEGLAEQAEDGFRKTIAIWERIITDLPPSAPYTARAYYFSAHCYRRLGEYEKAIECYQQVLGNWPDYKRAWNAPFMIRYCLEQLEKSTANHR